jgi:hypothetical protein
MRDRINLIAGPRHQQTRQVSVPFFPGDQLLERQSQFLFPCLMHMAGLSLHNQQPILTNRYRRHVLSD